MRRLFHSGILDLSRVAYSRACSGEWMEQGPTTTRTRSSWPARILAAAKRAEAIVLSDCWEETTSCLRSAGWRSGSYFEIARQIEGRADKMPVRWAAV